MPGTTGSGVGSWIDSVGGGVMGGWGVIGGRGVAVGSGVTRGVGCIVLFIGVGLGASAGGVAIAGDLSTGPWIARVGMHSTGWADRS